MNASPLAPPEPPRVYVHGLAHLDVVEHACGWTGTVHHDRRALGVATIRWHASFATTPVSDAVAAQLRLVARRGGLPTPPPEPTSSPWVARVAERWTRRAAAVRANVDALARLTR